MPPCRNCGHVHQFSAMCGFDFEDDCCGCMGYEPLEPLDLQADKKMEGI